MTKLEKYFNNFKNMNEMNHSFLICNTSYNEIENELKNIILKKLLCDKKELDTNLIIIKPEKGIISKEKIIELQEKCSQTSQISQNKVYVIDQCERMNPSAFNSLLKFLEEPEDNIYAFLISQNVNLVPLTIKSRCFIVQVSSETKAVTEDEDIIKDVVNIAVNIEKRHIKEAAYESNFIKKYDRERFKLFLKYIKLLYMDLINDMYNYPLEVFYDYKKELEEIINTIDISIITKKIVLLNDIENKFNSNLNINITFDKILIEMENIENENSYSKV